MTRLLSLTAALWLVLTSSFILNAWQPTPVQVGWCTPLKTLEAAKTAGFDYAELGTTELATMSDADFDQAAQLAYVRTAFTRLQKIGTTIVVFGSGGARRIPEGFDKAEAFKQLVDFGRRIAPEAQAHGITVAVEPLRQQESNIINSAGEGLELVNAIGHPNFQLMIDFYHLASEKEDPEIVIRAASHIRHLHTANPAGRVFPLEWTEFDYAPFFANLRKIGYDKRISVEASTTDFAGQAPRSIALLRRAFRD